MGEFTNDVNERKWLGLNQSAIRPNFVKGFTRNLAFSLIYFSISFHSNFYCDLIFVQSPVPYFIQFDDFHIFSLQQFPVFFLGETKISDDKRKQVYEAFGFMEKFLEGRKWFCGDNLTIADLAILASLSSIIVSFTFAYQIHDFNEIDINFSQHVGASLTDYPNLKRWFAQCATDVKGYQENDDGAKVFGDKVKSLLHDKFWS